jgi:hypothetical protein
MRDLDIHHPLQALEHCYGVFATTQEGTEPQFDRLYNNREEADARCRKLEDRGDFAILVDLRDATYFTSGLLE